MRTAALHLLEAALALTALYGVALIYLPAALILGGLAGVVAVERVLSQHPAARRKERR